MPAKEIDAVALESYQQYGMALMEFGAFRSLTPRKLFDMVDVEGVENLDKALAHGKGAILFTGHFGNWELLGAVIAQSGYPLHVTDTNHSNKLVHELISGLRIKQKMKIISVREPFSYFNDLLSSNCFVAYLADQDARHHGVFVDFMGRPASTVRGPAIFAIRNGCPVVATFMIRDGYDKHKAVFEEPIWPNAELTGREAVEDLTQRFTCVLEKYVRAYPGHYFWMHRRWKTSPPVPKDD
jgi:KDO2-lipid IV(A) lauroyltransferase